MRGTSTPRPLDSSISVSGILDHPHARVMTIENVFVFIRHSFAFSRRDPPKLKHERCPSKKA
jgi:hypothetical protein